MSNNRNQLNIIQPYWNYKAVTKNELLIVVLTWKNLLSKKKQGKKQVHFYKIVNEIYAQEKVRMNLQHSTKLVTPSSKIFNMRYLLCFVSEMVEQCTVKIKTKDGLKQQRHLETSLHAQQHCLAKKHWIGHKEAPIPACHKPAL